VLAHRESGGSSPGLAESPQTVSGATPRKALRQCWPIGGSGGWSPRVGRVAADPSAVPHRVSRYG